MLVKDINFLDKKKKRPEILAPITRLFAQDRQPFRQRIIKYSSPYSTRQEEDSTSRMIIFHINNNVVISVKDNQLP